MVKVQTKKIFWGLDSEASARGTVRQWGDIHSVQVCSSLGEHTGKVFYNAEGFKNWYNGRQRKYQPKIFYAFTLPFEYGSLMAWELLRASDEKGRLPWQHWTDKPINLFYIQIKKTRIPVFDVRVLFHQLKYGRGFLTSLHKLANYLSDYYHEDIHKLKTPLGADFGKRAPNMMKGEIPYFEKYGIRDAFIVAKAGEWLHSNIIEKWLHGKVDITRLFSWGTVSRHYFDLPEINQVKRFGYKTIVEFPNLWHQKIFGCTYAGRSEAFRTGNVGKQFYNDVGSLYPLAMVKSQCMLIRSVEDVTSDVNKDVLLGKASWEKFYECTSIPYGWLLGDFEVNDDLWALPLKVGETNWYVKGEFLNGLYNVLDLQASNAEIVKVHRVIVPIFEKSFAEQMGKFEELTKVKLFDEYESQIDKFCIKNTLNSTSGILGKSHPTFAAYTNIPAYNTLLAQSHLFMSQLFHKYHSEQHPISYTDTDSFFWDQPVGTEDEDKVIRDCEPYPTLPFQTLDTVPLRVGVRAVSCSEGAVIFRGKLYYMNEGADKQAFAGWKPFPKFFEEIVKKKPLEYYVERQVSRKWRTRDRKAVVLRVGRWFITREYWNLKKLKFIFRADTKRIRPTYDSYQLFLDNDSASSHAPTTEDVFRALSKEKWGVKVRG